MHMEKQHDVSAEKQRILKALEIVMDHSSPADKESLKNFEEQVGSAEGEELINLLKNRIKDLNRNVQVSTNFGPIVDWVYAEAHYFTERLSSFTLAKRRMFEPANNTACWVMEPGQEYLERLLDAIGRSDLKDKVRID